MITCKKCGESQADTEFYLIRKTEKRRDWCRTCVKEDVKKWQKDNPDRFRVTQRRAVLKREYGLTEDQYAAMLVSQSNSCAICGRAGDSSDRQFAVDHDHETGAVRGLLCHRCNLGLGLLRDRVDLLRRAHAYLLQDH